MTNDLNAKKDQSPWSEVWNSDAPLWKKIVVSPVAAITSIWPFKYMNQ
jgi:hypothetical protein